MTVPTGRNPLVTKLYSLRTIFYRFFAASRVCISVRKIPAMLGHEE